MSLHDGDAVGLEDIFPACVELFGDPKHLHKNSAYESADGKGTLHAMIPSI